MNTTTPVKAEMTKAEAKAVTDRIRKDIDSAWVNITLAFEGKAWKALGHPSWEAYVKAEFDMSRRHSYRLLDQGRVIRELAGASGVNETRVSHITARETAAVKNDLPAVTTEIKERIAAGEEPAVAVKETVAAKRQEKEQERQQKAAKQVEHDRQRDEQRAALPAKIQAMEAAKSRNRSKPEAAMPDKKWLESFDAAKDRIAELEEANRVLEKENAVLAAKVKLFAEMEAEWQQGGFAKVIAGKDEVIAVQGTRIERESADKVSWKRSSDMWRKRAEEAGWSNDVLIDINPREAAHG